jgi:di/tricarboxylate transporter
MARSVCPAFRAASPQIIQGIGGFESCVKAALHFLHGFLVVMLRLAIFALTGIIRGENVAGGVSWTLLLFVGGIFGLANVILEYKIADWRTRHFDPITGKRAFMVL